MKNSRGVRFWIRFFFSYIYRTTKNGHNNVLPIYFGCADDLFAVRCIRIGHNMSFACSRRTTQRLHIRSNDCGKEFGIRFVARTLGDATKLQYDGEKGFIWCATIAVLWTGSIGMCAIEFKLLIVCKSETVAKLFGFMDAFRPSERKLFTSFGPCTSVDLEDTLVVGASTAPRPPSNKTITAPIHNYAFCPQNSRIEPTLLWWLIQTIRTTLRANFIYIGWSPIYQWVERNTRKPYQPFSMNFVIFRANGCDKVSTTMLANTSLVMIDNNLFIDRFTSIQYKIQNPFRLHSTRSASILRSTSLHVIRLWANGIGNWCAAAGGTCEIRSHQLDGIVWWWRCPARSSRIHRIHFRILNRINTKQNIAETLSIELLVGRSPCGK